MNPALNRDDAGRVELLREIELEYGAGDGGRSETAAAVLTLAHSVMTAADHLSRLVVLTEELVSATAKNTAAIAALASHLEPIPALEGIRS